MYLKIKDLACRLNWSSSDQWAL